MKAKTKRELVLENARLQAEINERQVGVEAQYAEMEDLKAQVMAIYREKELLEDQCMAYAERIQAMDKVIDVIHSAEAIKDQPSFALSKVLIITNAYDVWELSRGGNVNGSINA